MKRTSLLITTLVASLLMTAGPSFGADESIGYGQKDECLLVALNCGTDARTITQTIDRLHKEINKGAAVYTKDELMKLNEKLEDANRTLDSLLLNG